jgi:hypothetical protein
MWRGSSDEMAGLGLLFKLMSCGVGWVRRGFDTITSLTASKHFLDLLVCLGFVYKATA